jgi:hypothetical protein
MMDKNYSDNIFTRGSITKDVIFDVDEFKKTRDREIYDKLSAYIPPYTLVGSNDEI